MTYLYILGIQYDIHDVVLERLVQEIRQELVGQAVQHALLAQGQVPLAVAAAIHVLRVQQRHLTAEAR